MFRSTHLRTLGVAVLGMTTFALGTGAAEAGGTCTYTESARSVKFTCRATTTSFSVCIADAQFAAYRGTPTTKRTSSFGSSATLSDATLYLVKGSEHCSAS